MEHDDARRRHERALAELRDARAALYGRTPGAGAEQRYREAVEREIRLRPQEHPPPPRAPVVPIAASGAASSSAEPRQLPLAPPATAFVAEELVEAAPDAPGAAGGRRLPGRLLLPLAAALVVAGVLLGIGVAPAVHPLAAASPTPSGSPSALAPLGPVQREVRIEHVAQTVPTGGRAEDVWDDPWFPIPESGYPKVARLVRLRHGTVFAVQTGPERICLFLRYTVSRSVESCTDPERFATAGVRMRVRDEIADTSGITAIEWLPTGELRWWTPPGDSGDAFS